MPTQTGRSYFFTAFLVVLLAWIVRVPGIAWAQDTDDTADDIVRLHLIWTNDLHGGVAPTGATFMNPDFPPPLGGGASASRYVEGVRAQIAADPNAAIMLLDAGDTWQGAPVGTLTRGDVMVAFFNAMGYDAVAIGNHEFDAGKELAIELSGRLTRPFLASNLYVEGTEDVVEWVEPYRIVEKAGLRIGVIGAITPGTEAAAFAKNVEGLDFGPIPPALEKYRDILRSQENVDLVFVVMHEGLPFDADLTWEELTRRIDDGVDLRTEARGAMEIAHVVEGIPVFVGGHTHRGYRDPWVDPVTHAMVFETYGRGSGIGHAILKIHRPSRQILGYQSPRRDGVLITLFEDEWWPEQTMADTLKPYIDQAEAGLDIVCGRSTVALTRSGAANSRMGMLVTDSMREAVQAEFAFSNTGGLRTDLSSGDITVGDLMELLPFGNSLVVINMDGRTIKRIIERKSGKNSSGMVLSGCDVVVDPEANFGNRVLQLTIRDGEPVRPDAFYRVVTSDFLMDGNSGLDFLAEIPLDHQDATGVLMRDAVYNYLQAHSPVTPQNDGRWREDVGGQRADYLNGWDDAPFQARVGETPDSR